MGEPLLRIDQVGKRFGGVHALRGAELAVRRGEVHSLVGANGSGKSTLLNILSGQVAPDAGTIVLDGEPVRFRDPSRALASGIATVTQETTLVPELSVTENILLGPRKVRRSCLRQVLHYRQKRQQPFREERHYQPRSLRPSPDRPYRPS